MLVCRNAEGVHGQEKVGNPWFRTSRTIRGCWEQWSASSFPGAAAPV